MDAIVNLELDFKVKPRYAEEMERPLTIGQIADLSGVSAATLRYYERMRLLPAPQRTPSGYRIYPRQILNRLAIVRNAQRFGFSLAEIAGFLRLRDSGGKPCHDVRAAGGRILEAVDAQIKELLATRKRLRRTLREWDQALAHTPARSLARLLEQPDRSPAPSLRPLRIERRLARPRS